MKTIYIGIMKYDGGWNVRINQRQELVSEDGQPEKVTRQFVDHDAMLEYVREQCLEMEE